MHFFLSKAVSFFLVPSNAIASLAVLGLVLLFFRRRSGPAVAGFAAAVVAVATLSPLGNLLLTPLEQRFPEQTYPDKSAIDGIIVLGGSYDTVSHSYMSTIFLREDTEPMAVVPGLAKLYPEAKIIISGGTDPSSPGPSEAAIVKQYYISFGIAADRISIEERSLTTVENARLTAAMIHPGPQTHWLLVTAPYHMPRAIGTFRKAGFNVIGFPAGWRTHGWADLWSPASTATDNLRRIDVAAHEWIGLVSYRLSGYSDEWLPGPNTGGSQQISLNAAKIGEGPKQ
jgi:uncharacterized SAM-binding protein YcdF (DUF218 family)